MQIDVKPGRSKNNFAASQKHLQSAVNSWIEKCGCVHPSQKLGQNWSDNKHEEWQLVKWMGRPHKAQIDGRPQTPRHSAASQLMLKLCWHTLQQLRLQHTNTHKKICKCPINLKIVHTLNTNLKNKWFRMSGKNHQNITPKHQPPKLT